MAEGQDKTFTGSTRFELQRRLGKGAFGVVYQAYDRQRDAVVALKTLREVGAEALFRFKREFRALAELIHPNLVKFYELLSDGEHWFFTMELIEGVALLDYVRGVPAAPVDDESPPSHPPATAPLTAFAGAEQRLRAALQQLVDGISVLHEVGIVHRDLKPANVLVTIDGRVVVLDFGLMGELAPGGYQEATTVGRFVGTPTYMAPEQIDQRPKAEACDWYSVGVMLYEVLTGQVPFTGTVLKQLVFKQQTDPPHPVQLVPGLPRDLVELCVDLLRRAPEQRPTGEQVRRRVGGSPTLEYDIDIPPESERPLSPQSADWAATVHRTVTATTNKRASVLCVHGGTDSRRKKVIGSVIDQLQTRHDDLVVLRGRCNQRETVPLQAVDSLVDVLCSYLRGLPSAEVKALVPSHTSALARLFPVLRRVRAVNAVSQPQSVMDESEIRKLGLGALRELLTNVAQRHKLVLCIDDLQWGDHDSATALLELLAGPQPPPLLLIACYHGERSESSPLLRSLLPALRQGALACEVNEIAV